jgi:hypothetical protein
VRDWVCRQRKTVEFTNLTACQALNYLQRMNFFELSGIKLPESFTRHDEAKRFVPLRQIDESTRGNVDGICREIAACVFPEMADSCVPEETGPHDLLEYSSSELINNVIQHARGTGYVAAQVYQRSDLVRVAVADCGIGILKSFEENSAPFWSPQMTHLDGVRTALQPQVSSKMHLQGGWSGGVVNAGVGLSMLRAIAHCAEGTFTLVSGDGFFQHNFFDQRSLPSELTIPAPFQGTICSVEVRKQKLGNVQVLLQNAKRELGLLDSSSRFDNLFT